MNHTPPPWEYSNMSGCDISDNAYSAFHIGAGNTLIAQVFGAYENMETDEANARLIAAAPQLLDAAQVALTTIINIWKKGIDDPDVIRSWNLLSDAIHTATQNQ